MLIGQKEKKGAVIAFTHHGVVEHYPTMKNICKFVKTSSSGFSVYLPPTGVKLVLPESIIH